MASPPATTQDAFPPPAAPSDRGGFGDADVVAAAPKSKVTEPVSKTVPAEITFKPRPVYTEEDVASRLKAKFSWKWSYGGWPNSHPARVQGLGHGLDESAIKAAEKIQFKPALKDGQPSDFQAVLHIVFQLAS